MSRKSARSVTSDARAAILGWPNLLARELYEAALQLAEKENRDVVLSDALAAWPIAVQKTGVLIQKNSRPSKSPRGKTNGKAA